MQNGDYCLYILADVSSHVKILICSFCLLVISVADLLSMGDINFDQFGQKPEQAIFELCPVTFLDHVV